MMNSARVKSLAALSMVAVAASLAACVTAHVAPTEGPVARFVVRTKTANRTMAMLELYDDAQTCKGGRKIWGNNDGASDALTNIRAGVLTTLNYSESTELQRCDVRISFFPKSGRAYLLDSYTGARCNLRLMDVTDRENPRMEPAVQRNKKSSYACEPLDAGLVAKMAASSVPGKPSLDDFKNLLRAE